MNLNLEESWKQFIGSEFEKPYFKLLSAFLAEEQISGNQIFPREDEIFNALNLTPIDEIKVVILGQDPYHGLGQAHGLSFSVKPGVKLPPSLKNVFKELKTEYPNYEIPTSGDLTTWAQQGVLLLNATLTVRAHQAGSHQKKGWEIFTDAIISKLSNNCNKLVFILWGNYAKEKEALIDATKHFIIKSAHPSPFSAHNGFLGSKPFGKANSFLLENGLMPINWQISDHKKGQIALAI